MSHRIHVWPWTRMLGRRVIPNWLAISLGRHVIAWRDLEGEELDHELEHVRQWQRHGWAFAIAYAVASISARRRGGHWYRDNRFEVEARNAAKGGRT